MLFMTDEILVAEDEQVMRSLLEKALKRWGYNVTAVPSAEQALEVFKPRKFAAVLSDMKMPGKSGMDLLGELRALDPETPVVLMTAFGSIATAVEAVKQGAADFVPKPFELPHLEMVLTRTLSSRRASQEIERLRPLADEREELCGMVGRSLPMKQVYNLIDKVAGRDLTVLILGDNGTGKELCALAIHELSPRKGKRLQIVNCASFQENLLESELFGHEKGSFTGADKRKLGHFEVAQGGTLFLDEVAEAPLSVQAKLLRAIQEKEILRVGGTDPIKIDVRILAATNRDLEEEVKAGRFREDLYYRISAFPIVVPPLCERLDDVPLLAEHILAQEVPAKSLSLDASLALTRYAWPGNVRELANVLRRAQVLAGDSPSIELEHIDAKITGSPGLPPGQVAHGNLLHLPLREAREQFERLYLDRVLSRAEGNVSHAAKAAGMGRASLHDKINKLGLDPDKYRP
jgi:DNA-binding NtrC family response regulator